jgi:N-acetylneuraminic acid mutarotase
MYISGSSVEPQNKFVFCLFMSFTYSNFKWQNRFSDQFMIVSQDIQATKTQIIDVINGETCSNLADFKRILYPVGTNLQGTPVLCGRDTYDYRHSFEFKCYKFIKNGGWKEFASLNGSRADAAGIVYNNKFHVFGGEGWIDGTYHHAVRQ